MKNNPVLTRHQKKEFQLEIIRRYKKLPQTKENLDKLDKAVNKAQSYPTID